MLPDLPQQSLFDPGLLLWVSPVDEENTPVDPAFLEAACRIGGDFLCYRARELNDEGLARELAERAVHRASRARKTRPVADPVAYVFRAFTNLVDAEIARSRRFVPLTQEIFDELAERPGPGSGRDIEREVEWKDLLESLDQTMRSVLEWLYRGYTIQEIARGLGITPNTLSQRVSRTRKELKRTLDHERKKGRTSEGDGQRRSGRVHPRRDLPPHGGRRTS